MLFRRICLLSFLPVIFAFSIYANAQQKPAYTFSTYLEDLEATKRESSFFFAGAVSLGLFNWDWGSTKSFKWNPEGWFGKNTGSGGADKLGHAFISYTITNVLADRLMRLGRSPERAAISASLTSQAIMLLVEVFDGFSKDHGFSYEDAVMNLTGTIFSYYRIVNPKLRELIDFRA
ncbi:MAG: YfiM family protein, partial [Thermodesulfovibrionales bacterium]|nr:YfiM family protein [Thermodesulfovibrionales bacterium]